MFTSFFSGPRRARAGLHSTSEDRLRRLLQSRALHPHRFHARCEIGPFVVANVCRERSLVVELRAQAGQRERQQQRAGFLAELGYSVLQICPCELRRHPRRVLRRIHAALSSPPGR
jgi:very-short-patch-repair endonuclease